MVQSDPKSYFTNGMIEITSESHILGKILFTFTKCTSDVCYAEIYNKETELNDTLRRSLN